MEKRGKKIKTTITINRHMWGLVKGAAIEHRRTASNMLEHIMMEYFKEK